ncbi:hypothetical protein AB3S75_006021 [Citrus x aurantiifolia]
MTVIAPKLDLSPDYDAVQEKKIIGGAGVDSSLLTQDSKTGSLLDLHKFTSNLLYNIILSLSSDFRVLGDKISLQVLFHLSPAPHEQLYLVSAKLIK